MFTLFTRVASSSLVLRLNMSNKEWTPKLLMREYNDNCAVKTLMCECDHCACKCHLVSIPYLVHNIFNRRTKLEDEQGEHSTHLH